ncbi:hypothetical protein [Hyphomicrobium sp. CS1BSMeth3]|uniref:hypothetical protein n=1 Tax=Hyphomicrobium sp. CS1BSMeth3 TaxID=1892844 RepID=UPI001FCE2182|nr:hypothetical protein [Hyphomicrobium sp. CS1BSMeth3]
MASNEHVAGAFVTGCRPLEAGTWRCGIICLALGLGAGGACLAQETPVGILMAHIRMQGFACDEPRNAERDAKASKPNVTVWVLSCGNARYRVTLIPDMKSRVEVIK